MPRGQFYTVFTLGFAAAIGFLGVLLGAVLFWSGEAWGWAYVVLNAHQVPNSWLEPSYVAVFVAGAALFIAYWIVQIQQTVVRWAADRAIAKLNRQYVEIAGRLGRDQADEFLRLQTIALIEGDETKRFDLFGRKEMLHGIAIAGIKLPA